MRTCGGIGGKAEHMYAVSSKNLGVKYSLRAKFHSNFASQDKLAHEAIIQNTLPSHIFTPNDISSYLSFIEFTSTT